MSEEPLLTLLAAGLASLRGVPPTPRSLDDDAVAAAVAAAARLRLDALAARGAVYLGAAPASVGLEEREAAARRRAAMFAAVSRKVSAALDDAGVAHAFFKGVVTDEILFGGRGYRGTSDLDILVADLDRAIAALTPMAQNAGVELSRPRLATQRTTRSLVLRVLGATAIADVQGKWLLSPPLIDDTAGVLARAVRVNGGLPRPAHEDFAAYIPANLVMDRFSGRLKLALDLAKLFERDDVDWTVVVARARRWLVAGALWAVARFVDERLGARAPPSLEALRPPLWRRPLLRACVEGAPIAGAFTRTLTGDDLLAGAKHFARYVPGRALDWLLDDPLGPLRRRAR